MAIAETFEQPLRAAPVRPVARQAPPVARRVTWIDAAKGGAIILVVIGHAWRGIGARDLISDPLFSAIDARIYAVHMPVFFALSGLFFATMLSRTEIRDFARSRLARLFWPMVIWTYLFLGLKVLAGEAANTPVALFDLLIWPVPGHLHLWFLWALLLLHMAFFLTRPFLRDGRYPAPVLAVFAVIALGLALLPIPAALDHWIGAARQYAPFFVLGMMLGTIGRLRDLDPRMGIVSAALALGVIVAWPGLSGAPVTDLLLKLLLTAAFIAAFAGLYGKLSATHWLVRLGTASMAIYLCHTLFSAAAREALLALGETGLGRHVLLGTAAGVIGPLILLWVARRTGTAGLLGFDGQNRFTVRGGTTVRHRATKYAAKRF